MRRRKLSLILFDYNSLIKKELSYILFEGFTFSLCHFGD